MDKLSLYKGGVCVSIFDRIMLSLYTLAVAAITLMVFGAYLVFPPGWNAAELGAFLTRWEAIPVAAFFFIFSVRFLLSGIRKERPSRATITHHSDLGDVRIAVSAVKNLAQKAAQSVRGVGSAKVKVELGESGLTIHADVSTTPDSSIPAITALLQDTLKRHVEASTGVTVVAVKVLVVEMAPASRVRVQ